MAYQVGVFNGDYIGPEIMAEALKILDVIAKKHNHQFDLTFLEASGEAFDKYGEHLPQHTLDKAAQCDALLKGPFGGPPEELNHPKWAGVEKGAILPLRKHFNLYTNLRETQVFDALRDLSPIKWDIVRGINVLIVRELTSGIYFGPKNNQVVDGERESSDLEVYRESEIRRIAKKAFEYAQNRNRKVTLVAKSNVLTSSVLWREVTAEVAKDYADVTLDYMHVDNASMQLILNPRQFDVILTNNIFGDILSDEASVLSGSIGLFPSASLGDTTLGLYEPIHGSAPSIAGKNIANPISTILSVALMLRYSFALHEEAASIERAVAEVLSKGHRTVDLVGPGQESANVVGTREMGDLIANEI
ncbi:3-isopropylmalate dehydrogenase [Alicyclobacillus fodiniaquatilis]|uniref:3-isopropylmalate dehydrogenase n=1 Tax=Alicyclobacillus fodiniaquatilis TaxID=1661150 RepID=A0ABW4JK18_9BACL